jgi:hypothetical protein
MNNTLVYLSLAGNPLPLSNGVPILGPAGNTGAALDIRVRNVNMGVNAPLDSLGLLPGLPAWDQVIVTPPPPKAAQVIASQAAKGVPLQRISSTEIYWTPDPDGEFVMMDPGTRKLVAISPLPIGDYHPVWYPLCVLLQAGRKEGLDQPTFGFDGDPKKVNPPVLPTVEYDRFSWADKGLFEKGVYVCLHPAPRGQVWTWDGSPSIVWDLDTINNDGDIGGTVLLRDMEVLAGYSSIPGSPAW